jgi:non-homologous end joining protein Ku
VLTNLVILDRMHWCTVRRYDKGLYYGIVMCSDSLRKSDRAVSDMDKSGEEDNMVWTCANSESD